ncbi:MarR family winged helix-turn-helix transcriptional regulator [Xanthomonas sp.]|uniref:MarR family winged helix-turn-helix transcriptional regulator n=1 Tax=Xanthomonas sp. TaxID=29446 RepID=UPI0031BAD0FC
MPKKAAKSPTDREIQMLHGALVDLVGVINRPQGDAAMVEEAGISLDSALFPLLVGIARVGPIGVVELAERFGRDYTTVSRQVAKLQKLKLVTRRAAQADARVNEASVTDKGRKMVDAIDAARRRIVTAMLADWSEQDVQRLTLLLRRLADSALLWEGALPRTRAA